MFLPGSSTPVSIPRGSEALFMLQRIRDEAHRFANTFHRELRGKRMTTSSLDGIAGLGEARRKKLVTALGGVNAVKKASLDTLQSLTFIPDAVAVAIYDKFHPVAPQAPLTRSTASLEDGGIVPDLRVDGDLLGAGTLLPPGPPEPA